MAVERFEDLVAWQRARLLTREIYRLMKEGLFTRDFGLTKQIQRAAVSVMANIAEGFDRNRPIEFARFLDIAKGSCAEVKSHLYVAHDVGYIERSQLSKLLDLTDETARVIAGLRRTTGKYSALTAESGLGTGDYHRDPRYSQGKA